MSMRQKALIVLVCAVVTAALLFSFLHKPEPRYRDIPLSYWLALHRSYELRELSKHMLIDAFREVPGRDTLGPEAAEAVRQIGTNALPSLIAWMNLRQDSWKMKLAQAVFKLPPGIRPKALPAYISYARDSDRCSLAYTGFRILGPSATPAIPDLARIARDPGALGWASAVDVMVGIGKPAVPALADLLSTNVPNAKRGKVLGGLGYLGPNAAAAVPAIIACLGQPDDQLACEAARTLGRIRWRSDIAIPALIERLDDSRYAMRLSAVKALGDYGSDASPAVSRLRELLAQPDVQLGNEADQALLRIASASSVEPFETRINPMIESLGLP